MKAVYSFKRILGFFLTIVSPSSQSVPVFPFIDEQLHIPVT